MRLGGSAIRLGAHFQIKPNPWEEAEALAHRLIARVEHKPCPDRRPEQE